MKRTAFVLLAALLLTNLLACTNQIAASRTTGLSSVAQPSASSTTQRPELPVLPGTGIMLPTTVPTLPTTVPVPPTTVPVPPTTVPVPPTTVPVPPTTVPVPPTTMPPPPTTLPTRPTTLPVPPTTAPMVPDENGHYPELDPGKIWEVFGADTVNIRSNPYSSSSNVIGQVPQGTRVEVLGWTEKFARIRYNGRNAYIMASYIKPADKTYMDNALDIVEITDTYSYEEMMDDLIAFHMSYPELVQLEVAGYSELGNQIPVIRIGDPEAEYHVLLQGAIHGREHMTAWLLMAMIDYWLDRDLFAYGDVCYHIIPMSNPDGVIVSQSETLPEYLQSLYQSDREHGYATGNVKAYLSGFKANALGVDLNRNFPAGWEELSSVREDPSCSLHPGTEAFSAAEARVLRDYTLSYPFDVTISYHAMGSVIYYEYGDKEPVNTLSESLGRKVRDLTGYTMMGSNTVGAGGYKDWAINSLQIPSLTIEIGSQNTPLAERELYSIFARNCDILPTIAKWLRR